MNDEQLRAVRTANLRLDVVLRLAYLRDAEELSRRSLGRHLTAAELDRVLRRYPWSEPPRPSPGGGSTP